MDKTFKKLFISVDTIVILFAISISLINGKGNITLFAHDAQLEIFYDSCIPEPYYISGDIVGTEDEKWYLLDDGINMQHIGHSNGPTEIKYFIHNLSKDGNTSWNHITNQTMRENVKAWFINGICKWNNICFYKPNGSNCISKHNLVSISEGTLNNHNLSIYPEVFGEDNSTIAYAIPSDNCSSVLIDSYLGITHHHCDK